MRKLLLITVGLALLLVIPSLTAAAVAPRAVMNPANNSPLSSAVMRNELQILENEVTNIANALGWNATSTQATTVVANGCAQWSSNILITTGVNCGSGNSSFSTTSAAYFLSLNQGNAFSTTSASYFLGQNTGNAFSTTSASVFLSLNQGNAFSTTSVNYWKSQTTFTGASTTALSDNNTFSGINIFSNALSNFQGLWQGFSPSHFATAGSSAASSTLLGDNNTFSGLNTFGQAIVASITGNAGTATKFQTTRTINNVSFDGTANITVTAASSTILADNNTFSGSDNFTQNVGIGTSTPNAKVNVFSTTNSTVNTLTRLVNSGSGNGTGERLGFSYNGNPADHAFIQGDFLDATRGQSLQFGTGGGVSTDGTINMTLTGQGNLGIGTATPNASLEIASTSAGVVYPLLLSDANSNSEVQIRLQPSTAATRYNVISAVNNGSNAIDTLFDTANGALPTERMRITAAGNVGIATNTPATTLSVTGSGYFTGGGLGVGVLNTTSGTLQTFGNIGIGVAPTTGLTFNPVTGNKVSLFTNFGFGINGSELEEYANTGAHISFNFGGFQATGLNEGMRISQTSVGIGTTSPGTMFAIGSSTHAINFDVYATSTFTTAGGVNLTNGCFAIAGTCITSGSAASSTLLTDNNAFSGNNIFSQITQFSNGFLSQASSTITGNLTLATTTTTAINGVIVVASSSAATTAGLTTNIQNAINLCSSLYAIGQCGEVYFPAGIYSVTPNTIALKSNVDLAGAGEGTVFTEPTTAGSWYLFNGTSVKNIKITDMFLSGTHTSPFGTVPQNNTWGLYLSNDTNIIVQDVRFEQFFEDIEGSNVSGASFTRVYDYSGGQGYGTQDLINIDALATSTIADARCYASDTCVRLQGGVSDINITGSQFYAGSIEIGNGEGTAASQNINIVGNSWVGSVGYPITLINFNSTSVVPVGGGYFAGVRGVNITGNTFNLATSTSNNYQAIVGENSGFTGSTTIADVTITNNTFVSNANGGIHTKAAMIEGVDNGVALRWNVNSNNIASSTGDAIKMVSPVDSKITNNIASNYGTNQNAQTDEACIYVGGTNYATSSNTEIYGNHCVGPTAPGVTSSGIYVDNSTYVTSLDLYLNQLYNTTTPINYGTSAPAFTPNVFYGNFGIGGNPLDTFTTQGGGDSLSLQTNGNGPRIMFGNASTENQYFQFGSYNNVNNIEGFNSRDLVFSQNSSEKMRIAVNGNIGIASSTPGSLLSLGVAGNASGINFSLATSTFANAGGINITTGCFAKNGTCLTSNSGTVTSVAVDGTLNGGTITTSGTLGLNLAHSNWWTATQNFTNASTSEFTATSTSWFLGATNFGSSQQSSISATGVLSLGAALAVSSGGTGTSTWQTGSVPFYNGSNLTENNANLFWDNTHLRLGIGTVSPNDNVTVVTGNDSVNLQTGNGPRVLIGTAGTDNAYMSFGAYNSQNNIEDFGSRDMVFSQNSSEKMRLTVAGNLGIGTSTPQSKLVVTKGPSATTTIAFGELGLSSSKACVNLQTDAGTAGFLYLNAAGGIVSGLGSCTP